MAWRLLDEVDQPYSRLETAYNGLAVRKPTMDSLKALIAEYKKIEKDNYIDESWAVFTNALTAAKAVVEKPDATSGEITQTILIPLLVKKTRLEIL